MNIAFFLTSVFYALASKISYDDWKKKEVKAIDLFFLAILSFTPYLLNTKASPSLSWLTYLFISILFLEEYLEKKIIGTADWIVLFSISFRLSLSQIPFFLALSGFFGIITYFIKKEKMIPFVPSLFLSSLLCELCPMH